MSWWRRLFDEGRSNGNSTLSFATTPMSRSRTSLHGSPGIGGPAGDPSMGGFSGGSEDKRFRVELYLAGTNLLNHMNPGAYSGVLTSPFYGRLTSAGAPRKLELGVRFGF